MNLLNWTIPLPQPRVAETVSTPRLLAWNVPQSELVHIPEHWLSYPEPEASMHYLLLLLYVALFIMAIIGNGLVIWIFSSAKSLRTPSNMFVVNLALCDFIMMLKAPIFIYNTIYKGYATGHIGCQIFGFAGALSGIGAGMTNAFIAYDRYSTITSPFEKKLTRIKAFIIILFIWGYTIPWAVLPLLEVWSKYVPEGYLTSCTFDYLSDTFDNHVFVASIFVCSYVIPLILMIYFYTQIVSQVFQHEKALREQAKKMNVQSLRSNQDQAAQSVEIRIAKAAITMCFLFLASWTPYAVLALIGAFGDQSLLTPGVTMIPAVTCKLVACIDPYVYAISHPKYRVELQKKLPWLAIKESLPSDAQSAVTESTAAPAAATTAA